MKQIIAADKKNLLTLLKGRFKNNMHRHIHADWEKIEGKIISDNNIFSTLKNMEDTGGEPDVVEFGKNGNDFSFVDCVIESPADRRSVCYDQEGLQSRKENKPADTVVDMSEAIGAKLLNEAEYRHLQTLGNFDTKTSSWIFTPVDFRKKGGALFAEKRYGQVFIYHNGAQSYYSARGFRCIKPL